MYNVNAGITLLRALDTGNLKKIMALSEKRRMETLDPPMRSLLLENLCNTTDPQQFFAIL